MADAASVAFVDLPAQYRDMRDEILGDIGALIDKSQFVGGPPLARFEEALAAYCGVRHAVGCSDGTAALVLALKGAGLRPGDGVVVPTNSFIASANAVVHAGGAPVLVDCDPETYLLDLAQAEAALAAGRARFLLPVHLYGVPCPMEGVLALARAHDAAVIEDNAQALGATLPGGARTGSAGLAAGVSFYPAKNLGAFGQAGAILTDSDTLARTARTYAEQGTGSTRYHHDVIGWNNRLDTLQAVVLARLLPRLDGFNEGRRRAAAWYAARLPADRLQRVPAGATPCWHLFEYRCDSPDHRGRLQAALDEARIGWGLHYPIPIHRQRAYAHLPTQALPVAERLAETLLSLPMHPNLTEEQVDGVCAVVNRVDPRRA